MVFTDVPTLPTGHVLTSTDWDTYIADNMAAMFPNGTTYTGYTPALTAATTNPTLGSGSTASGRYLRIGDQVHVQIYVEFGTSGTNAGAGTYFVSVPVDIAADIDVGVVVGSGFLVDSSGPTRGPVAVQRVSTSTVRMLYDNDHTAAGLVNATAPFAWSTSDVISLMLTYEAA